MTIITNGENINLDGTKHDPIPLFLCKIQNKEIIVHMLENLEKLGPDHIYLILRPIDFEKCAFLWKLFPSLNITFISHSGSSGTVHALQTFVRNLHNEMKSWQILVLEATMPHISADILQRCVRAMKKDKNVAIVSGSDKKHVGVYLYQSRDLIRCLQTTQDHLKLGLNDLYNRLPDNGATTFPIQTYEEESFF